MTTWPELKLGSHLYRGLAAAVLFVVMAVVFLGAPFGAPTGFEGQPNVTASIGYAMFDITRSASEIVASEGFLVAFEIIDLVLVAALAAAVLLARRESGGQVASRIVADGGRKLSDSLRVRRNPSDSEGGRELKRTLFGSAEDGEETDVAGGER